MEKKFYNELIVNINELKQIIKSIDFNIILKVMGFPKNYESLLEI